MPKTVEKVREQLPSEIKDVTGMFSLSSNFNQDISNWDVSNVINMNYMFLFTSSFNQDISIWDVSNVKEHKNFAGNSGITDPNKLPKFPN
ncbi:BspA family leucine-rich repeat surface protein [Spiroplasma endosymbiont of Notiophilus biguttatus]|uniref:BspA family leucine-rich repeat surface protein n=1 Tax=Spiroplasma endosymbiont of Notiophilus biguttatus TaxID=3066285 RepID=UPI00313ACB38